MSSQPRARLRARLLLAVLPAAFAAVLLSGAQTPADAGLLDDLLSGPGSVTGPVVGGIGGLACDHADQLPESARGLCVLRSAHIKYRTTYLRPDGTELVRSVNAMVALPSAINADDDLLPEGSALLAIKSTNTFTLRFDRALLETGTVPVKFEVIVPMPGANPKRDSVFIGFDARQGRMPQRWTGRIVLLENTPTVTDLGIEIERTGAAPRLQVIGGLFDGSVGNRVDPIAAVIDPQPVPAELAANLRMVDAPTTGEELAISASASSTTTISATLENVDGPDRQDVTAYVKDLGADPVRVRVESPTSTEQHVYYDAEDRMPKVRFTSEDRHAGTLTDRLRVQLNDLPEKLEFHQPSPGKGSLVTTGGHLGKTRVSINDGHFAPFPANDGPHVTYLYDGELGKEPADAVVPNALDLEIDRLTAASFDATGDFTVDVTTDSGTQPQNLRGYVKDHVNIVDATVFDIPGHVKVVATDGGEIRYDGHGDTVPEITAHIEAIDGTLSPESRYTQVDARILELPPLVNVTVSPDKNHIVADADGDAAPDQPGTSVGSLRVHARDQVSACESDLGEDNRGAAFVDTPANACIAARFDGLREADVTLEPLDVHVLARAKQDLVIRGRVDEAGDSVNAIGVLDGKVTQAPKDFGLKVVPGDTTLPDTTKVYQVRADDRTPHLTLTGTNLPTSFGNGFIDFDITDVAREIDAELPDEGEFQTLVLDAPGGIGKAELELAEKNTPCLNTVTKESGVGIIDTPLAHCIGVRVSGVKYAELQLEPLHLKTELTHAQEFQIAAKIDDPDDAVGTVGVIDALITELPRELEISSSTGAIAGSPGSSTLDLMIDIPSAEAITSLVFNGTGLPEAFPDRFMKLRVDNVTDKTSIRVPKDGEVQAFALNTVVAPIELIEVQLSEDGADVAVDPDRDSVVVTDETVGVRIHDLKRARFQNRLGEGPRYDGTLEVYALHTQDPYPHALDVLVDDQGEPGAADDTHIVVELAKQPTEIGFTREGNYSPGALYSPDRPSWMRLAASDTIENLVFEMDQGPDSSIDLHARDLPAALNICLWSGGGTDHQVRYSNPNLSDPTWCYQPEKKPWREGGDPFALFDTVQFTLASPGNVHDLPEGELISIDKLDLRSKDATGTSRTTVTEAKFGLMKFAFGQGFIWGDYNDPAMRNMYGGDMDNEDWDGVFDEELPDRKGLHLYADTDDNGFSARLRYEFVDAVTHDSEVTILTSLKKLVAHDKITVLDMTGIPGEVRQQGYIGVCSLDPALFELRLPGFPPIVAAAALADFMNCDL